MQPNLVSLRDPQSGATARIAAGLGFNCFDFTVRRGERTVAILWSAADYTAGTARPSGSGIPILFPFPGRLHGSSFRWAGKEYQLSAADGRGNAIHGFVMHRPWRIVEQSDQRVVGEFHASRDDSQLLALWPADFRIRVSYELVGETLASLITIDNPDTRDLPCGLGTHPYFRVPLGGPHAEDCLVRLPVSDQWELADMVTTGRRIPVTGVDRLRTGAPFRELQLDNVFSGLVPDGELIASSIHDPAGAMTVEQRFDRQFRECVVYTPPHREAICIEPYSCVPGFFELSERGVDAGMLVLKPGETRQFRVDIAVR